MTSKLFAILKLNKPSSCFVLFSHSKYRYSLFILSFMWRSFELFSNTISAERCAIYFFVEIMNIPGNKNTVNCSMALIKCIHGKLYTQLGMNSRSYLSLTFPLHRSLTCVEWAALSSWKNPVRVASISFNCDISASLIILCTTMSRVIWGLKIIKSNRQEKMLVNKLIYSLVYWNISY